MSYAWIVWLILAAIFIAVEVLTPGFFLLWFGVGALAAALLAVLGVGSLPAQIIVFLAISVALLIASRTIFEKFLPLSSSAKGLKTNVETMIGQVGTVVEASRGALNEAAVKVYGSTWTAFPISGEKPLTEGETVAVERIDGNRIYVRRSHKHALLFSESSEEV
ncbi:MAG TPA: NfeD family protein [Blastocatellia bacterium]|nr:NfeD family protein [Blastocatellia bacterium]